jgi:hypothetical protein
MRAMTVVAEQVHQRAREHDGEGQQLGQVLVVPEVQPRHGCGQTEPQQPLVDARPVRFGFLTLGKRASMFAAFLLPPMLMTIAWACPRKPHADAGRS